MLNSRTFAASDGVRTTRTVADRVMTLAVTSSRSRSRPTLAEFGPTMLAQDHLLVCLISSVFCSTGKGTAAISRSSDPIERVM